MKVMLASSEAVPFAKTGGLADVTGALAKALARAGATVKLVMPLYAEVKKSHSPEKLGSVPISLGDSVETAEIYTLKSPDGFDVLFIGHEGFYGREELYATARGEYPDNDKRFIFFSKAVLEAVLLAGFVPDIIHCNDWQTALVPVLLKTGKRWDFPSTVTILTIHNLGYQGIFEPSAMRYTGLPYDLFHPDILEFHGKLNLLKAGIVFSDAISTVSERYAYEICTPELGFGLDGVLLNRSDSISGITNGIDYDVWNPETDIHLPASYGPANMSGKTAARYELLGRAGFRNTGTPVIGMVGRLAHQKGLDILMESLEDIFDEGARLVILGRGDADIQSRFSMLAKKNPLSLFFNTGFNEPLAHLIYAGSDMFLMPSRYEPCGL